jgi:hypothetical protein
MSGLVSMPFRRCSESYATGIVFYAVLGGNVLVVCSHLHLHVISSDLHSETMKNKKHYNSFHPKHGFFLHYDDVMSWFDAVPSFFRDVRSLLLILFDDVR